MMLPLLANLLGKTEEEAIQMIQAEKLVVRVIKEGETDHSEKGLESIKHNRINLHLKDGKVIKAFVG